MAKNEKTWNCEACGSECGTKEEYPQDTRYETADGEKWCLDCMEQIEVDVIASGYEWTCPICENLNNVIAFKNKVVCQECERTFEASCPEHAYD